MTSPSLTAIESELAAAEAEQERLLVQYAEMNKAIYAANERKRALEAQRQKLEEEARNSTPIELRVCDLDVKGIVNVKVIPDMRPDLLPIMRSIPGRVWDVSAGVNRIPIDAWNATQPALAALQNVRITHLLGVDDKIRRFMNRPEFCVKLMGKELRIESHPKAERWAIMGLPGAAWATNNVDIKLPISEAWRLLDVFANYLREGIKREVEWDAKALELAEHDLRRRMALDEVLLLKDADVEVHFVRGQELMPFQRVGVKALDTTEGVAFLADQMGLGKTWQFIAYAIMNKLERIVIVCPAHLKPNWMREIINLTGEIPLVLFGRDPDQNDINNLIVTKPRWVIINYDIIGAKTEMDAVDEVGEDGHMHRTPKHERYLWAELLNMYKPQLIGWDEAHYCKSRTAHRAKACASLVAPHRIPISGTPILNRPGEFFTALNWLMPAVFPSPEKFDQQFTNNGKGSKNVAQLRELLKPLMIRRLKKDVISDLPPINRIVKLLELSEQGKIRYAEVLKGLYKVIDDAGNEVEKSITNILVEMGKLKEVCAMDAVPHTVDHARELLDSEEDDRGQGKILIQSYYKDVVRAIAARLDCPYWTGDTDQDRRNKLEKDFQDPNGPRFLVVSLMSAQTGLNLTAAGHVIQNDLYWTPAAHAQFEERAYGRLSDCHGADSYYFMASGTIMEWVWTDIIQPKIALINEVVEGLDGERDVGAIMGLIQKFKQLRGTL